MKSCQKLGSTAPAVRRGQLLEICSKDTFDVSKSFGSSNQQMANLNGFHSTERKILNLAVQGSPSLRSGAKSDKDGVHQVPWTMGAQRASVT